VRRAWLAVVGAVTCLIFATAIAMAQSPPPTVPLAATPTSATIGTGAPLPAGPTTFRVTASERGMSVYFGILVAGATVEQLQAALRSDDRTGNDLSLGLLSVQASVVLEPTQTTRDVTFTLKPGQTYVVMTEPATEDEAPASRGFATFTTTGTPNGATAAAPDATVRMVGLRFRGDRTLPRNGTIRVDNASGSPHIAIAVPLRRGVNNARLGRALRSDDEAAFGRVAAGQPVTVSSVISGAAADDQQVQFSRGGRYALICFLGEHHKLGMYRIVSVR
jgi:hypothetical protein